MTYPLIIENVEKVTKVTLNGTVSRGQPIGYDGTGFVRADADAAATSLFAQFIALSDGVSGDVIEACKVCTCWDEDAPYTANTRQYLSSTAGAVTETRPTAAGAIIQVLGRSTDAYHVLFDIKAPREFEVFLPPCTYDGTGEPGLGVVDSPAWVGQAIDTGAEFVFFQGRIPSNALSVAAARVVWNDIGETTGTVSGAIIVCADGAVNTGDTGTAFSAAAPTALGDNKLVYSDIVACFSMTTLAGYNFSVKMLGAGAYTGDLQALGLYMRYIVV